MMTSFTPLTITFFICLMTAWVGSVYAQTSQPVSTIEFRQQDQVIKSLHPEELGTVTNRVILTVFEVHERRERRMRLFSAAGMVISLLFRLQNFLLMMPILQLPMQIIPLSCWTISCRIMKRWNWGRFT